MGVGKVSGIYTIRHLDSGRVYVGQSHDLDSRLRKHRTRLRSGKHENAHLQNAWNKHGEQSFWFSVVELVPVDELNAAEHRWFIATACCTRRRGFNIAVDPSAPSRGIRRKFSAEARANISAGHKGLRHSAETRAKISASHRGKKFTAQHCANISAAKQGRRVGYKYTEAARANMRAAQAAAAARRAANGVVRVVSEETRAKQSAVQKARLESPEARAKQSAAAVAGWAKRKAAKRLV